MKNMLSAILSVILVLQMFLFTGCGRVEEAEATLSSESPAVTEALETVAQTVPEVTEPEVPARCWYPAVQAEEGITFPCLLENHEDAVYTLDSLVVIYYTEETPVETVTYSPAELEAFTWWGDTSLVLEPADAVLQTVPSVLSGDAFEWAELIFTLLDPQGQESVRSFFYTTKSDCMNTTFVDDGETWDFPFFVNGDSWSFRYVITNLPHHTGKVGDFRLE